MKHGTKESFRILGDFFYDRFYGFEQFLVIMEKNRQI